MITSKDPENNIFIKTNEDLMDVYKNFLLKPFDENMLSNFVFAPYPFFDLKILYSETPANLIFGHKVLSKIMLNSMKKFSSTQRNFFLNTILDEVAKKSGTNIVKDGVNVKAMMENIPEYVFVKEIDPDNQLAYVFALEPHSLGTYKFNFSDAKFKRDFFIKEAIRRENESIAGFYGIAEKYNKQKSIMSNPDLTKAFFKKNIDR